MDADDAKSPLPWRWVFEHLVGIPTVGTPILREILTSVPEITLSSGLDQRVALRYLEEAVSARKIDANIIPLLTTLAERASASSYPTSVDYSSLLLRVRIEAVSTYIRASPRDWHGFGHAVDRLFSSDTEDTALLEKRKQLIGLLQDRNEKKCKELLEAYPLNSLQSDIGKCIASEKARIKATFFDKLLQDDGESQEDFHSADMQRISIGSDEPTEIVTRHSNAASEEDVASGHEEPVGTESAKSENLKQQTANDIPVGKLEKRFNASVPDSNSKSKKKVLFQDSKPQLRQRDQHGKAITSLRHVKDARDLKTLVCSKMAAEDKDASNKEECCYRCKKGRELLHCDGCPIVVHRTCLGSDFTDLVQGEWFCPLCLQKKAAEAVTKARKEEMAARERVARFMAGPDIEKAEEKENHSIATFRTVSDARMKSNADSAINKTVDGKKVIGDSIDASKEMKAVPEIAVHIGIELPEKAKFQKASRKIIDDVCEHYHLTGNQGDHAKTIIDVIASDTIRGTPKEDDVGTSLKTEGELQKHTVQTDLQQLQVADGDGHDGDIEESGDGDVEKEHLKGKPKLKMREKSLILGRRKRLPWSKEEEDTLKEGVKKFSHDGTWGFKWTRILEFGHGKFHPSRTDVDLKDKWRNMTKATS